MATLDPDADSNDTEQPLVQHLIELRNRLLRSLLCVLVVFAALFSFSNDIYTFVSAPLQKFLPEGASMIATEVASPFLTPFKLTLFASIFISIPFLLYQLWAFVAPALYRKEKRLAMPLLISSVVLFYTGMAFAYFVVFPLIFEFFTSMSPDGVTVMTDIGRYLDFVLKLFFAFGLAFEIPVATVLLISAGVTTADRLARKRPYIVVSCFVLGMLLTPPDVISQSLLALPMWLLFEIGVILGRMVTRQEDQISESNSAE
ncbi:twin-arginine translocase subunit TatC [Exilibacterium tricleocarpae]|uniref:Sec-independent protein translocase protein TatC n=1 Tax=Exilibacterium tricleocarpae TaxID=2591008 RepID=A0A545T614_9GAMM|nr:twin-arginine translocase subunit TatC [Exilibacterium tricleocarpae]TQV72670.1 twin-arginine translocase subunit TatC [Exilibacterium tricleocarpae]